MRESIRSILEDNSLVVSDRYIKLYRELLSGNYENSYSVFKEIVEVSNDISFENVEDEDDDDSPLIRHITNRYFRLLGELVVSISRMNLFSEGFYERLYASVFQSDVFPQTDSERGIILYLLSLKIYGLPYYQAKDPVILENSRFTDLVGEIEKELDKALYMMKNRFDSRTEAASQLCDIADSLDSREKKAVFWACVLQTRRPKDDDSDD